MKDSRPPQGHETAGFSLQFHAISLDPNHPRLDMHMERPPEFFPKVEGVFWGRSTILIVSHENSWFNSLTTWLCYLIWLHVLARDWFSKALYTVSDGLRETLIDSSCWIWFLCLSIALGRTGTRFCSGVSWRCAGPTTLSLTRLTLMWVSLHLTATALTFSILLGHLLISSTGLDFWFKDHSLQYW